MLGYFLAFAEGQLFREGLFQFMTSFSLPWYAIVGAQKGVESALPVLGLLLSPWSARPRAVIIDVSCGVPAETVHPRRMVRLDRAPDRRVWILCACSAVQRPVAAVGIAFAIGFTLRVIALYRGWEEPLAKEPAGVYQHADGRPLLGRKLKGKSQRELRDLGLSAAPDAGHAGPRDEDDDREEPTRGGLRKGYGIDIVALFICLGVPDAAFRRTKKIQHLLPTPEPRASVMTQCPQPFSSCVASGRGDGACNRSPEPEQASKGAES